MEFELYVNKKKEIYSSLLDYLDSCDDWENNFKSIIDILNKQDIFEDKEQIFELLNLISKIEENYHRTSNFYPKIIKLIDFIIKQKNQSISNDDIFQIFQSNILILLHLFEQEILIPTESIIDTIYDLKHPNGMKYSYFLFNSIKKYINENKIKSIVNKISNEFEESLEEFAEKCRIGENDSYICSLIRKDSIDEFVIYTNKNNIPLSNCIKKSKFETNPFLISKNPTLIEYATFFGSIQIFQYLRFNQVELTESLWLYAIHSKNAEIIHLLEELEVKPDDATFKNCFFESIICHYNDICDYIKDNLIPICKSETFVRQSELFMIDSCNYYYYINDIKQIISLPNNHFGFTFLNMCPSLSCITIPSDMQHIRYSAFKDCASLKKVVIPSSIVSIGNSSFEGCSSLVDISFSPSIISIGNSSFKGCSSLKEITIPPSVTHIANDLFKDCSSLKEIIIPSSIISIGNWSFEGCSSLIEFSIPSSVTSIGKCAFKDCSSLKQMIIPSSVTSMGNEVFKGCSSLAKIFLSSSMSSIEDSTFEGCSSLGEIIIPSSVTSIGNNAFKDCKSLKQLTIPTSIKSIGNCAFEKCISLKYIPILSSVTTIGYNAFYECQSLEEIAIPPSVTEVKSSTFYGCSSLKEITIPPSVKSIGSSAFYNCSSLNKISIPSSVTKFGVDIFKGIENLEITESNTMIPKKLFY